MRTVAPLVPWAEDEGDVSVMMRNNESWENNKHVSTGKY